MKRAVDSFLLLIFIYVTFSETALSYQRGGIAQHIVRYKLVERQIPITGKHTDPSECQGFSHVLRTQQFPFSSHIFFCPTTTTTQGGSRRGLGVCVKTAPLFLFPFYLFFFPPRESSREEWGKGGRRGLGKGGRRGVGKGGEKRGGEGRVTPMTWKG